MPKTLKDAKDAFGRFKQEINQSFEPATAKRTVYLGDGKGTGSSNLVVGSNPAFLWARESLQTKQYFPVRLNRSVRPSFNLPVIVGKKQGEPCERILDVDETFMDFNSGASILSGTGPHHTQHEFGGGDEVFVDSKLFKPGLARPTSPKSLSIVILSFVHYVDSWQRFDQTEFDLTEYVPSSGSVYVTVCVDPLDGSVVAIKGSAISSTFAAPFEGGFPSIPSPPSNLIPITAVFLNSGATKIDWDKLFDIRLHISSPQKDNSDRIGVLEKMFSYDPEFMMMGVQQEEYAPFIDVLDGGVF